MKAGVVVGHPRRSSQTLAIARELADTLLDGVRHELVVVDLAEHQRSLFERTRQATDLAEKVADCELLVVASPDLGPSYSGLLGSFLDLYPEGGLGGVAAIPVLTGADAMHSSRTTLTLAPALLGLGAVLVGPGYYFVASEDQAQERPQAVTAQIDRAAAECAANIASVAAISSAMPRSSFV